MNKDKENKAINLLKGISIILVIINHYNWTEPDRLFALFPFIIEMAVPVFMFMSGYVYTISYDDKGISTFTSCYDKTIVTKRFIRYTLPYIIICVWEIIDPHIDTKRSILGYLKWVINGTNGPGSYYYPLLIQMIIVFPFIYMAIRWWQHRGLMACLCINAIYELLTWSFDMNETCYRLLVFRYIFLLAAGAYSFYCPLSIGESIVFMTVGIAFVMITTYSAYQAKILNYWTSTCFISAMYIIPIISMIARKATFSIKPLNLIGKASYHIFLVQMVYYMGYFRSISDMITNPSICILVTLLITVMAGIMFYIIETPINCRILSMLCSLGGWQFVKKRNNID